MPFHESLNYCLILTLDVSKVRRVQVSRGNTCNGYTLPVFDSASIAWTVDTWFRNNCYILNNRSHGTAYSRPIFDPSEVEIDQYLFLVEEFWIKTLTNLFFIVSIVAANDTPTKTLRRDCVSKCVE